MKKVLMTIVTICTIGVMSGCGTTFQERLEIYKAAYGELKTLAPVAAKVFLAKQVADGKLTQEEADEIVAALKNK